MSFFENRAEKFRLPVEKEVSGLSSCFLILHKNILQKNVLKRFCFFADFFRINFGIWTGKNWPACQNCILRVYRNIFWKKNCFGKQMKFFIIFRHWAEVFGPCLFFWRVCWNCILRVHRNTLGKKMFFKTYTFALILYKKRIFIRNLVGKNSAGLS